MDEPLLQRIKNKDKEAFEELYNQHAAYATVAIAVTRNHELARCAQRPYPGLL